MSNMLVLDLFNSMRAGRRSSSYPLYIDRYEEDEYEELGDEYQDLELVPTKLTIKPIYRWAIRVVVVTGAIVIVMGNILAEEHIILKIVSVVAMILAVWFAFAETEDALVYKVKRVTRIPPESMV